jgi:hypothetical protein
MNILSALDEIASEIQEQNPCIALAIDRISDALAKPAGKKWLVHIPYEGVATIPVEKASEPEMFGDEVTHKMQTNYLDPGIRRFFRDKGNVEDTDDRTFSGVVQRAEKNFKRKTAAGTLEDFITEKTHEARPYFYAIRDATKKALGMILKTDRYDENLHKEIISIQTNLDKLDSLVEKGIQEFHRRCTEKKAFESAFPPDEEALLYQRFLNKTQEDLNTELQHAINFYKTHQPAPGRPLSKKIESLSNYLRQVAKNLKERFEYIKQNIKKDA